MEVDRAAVEWKNDPLIGAFVVGTLRVAARLTRRRVLPEVEKSIFPLDSGCKTCRAIEYRICVMQRVHGSKEAGQCLVLVFAEVDPQQRPVQSQQAK